MSSAGPRTRLVVLYGGQSAEHDVSRISAAGVLRAVDPDRYDVDPIAITRDGHWIRSTATVAALAEGPQAIPASLDVTGTEVSPQLDLVPSSSGQPVVVLPILHGPRGEDGAVQGLLELADVAYVGCGVLGSAVNMDKGVEKVLAAAAGIPVVPHLTLRDQEIDDALVARIETDLGWPVFVKPANMGSSVGVGRADSAETLRAALDEAARYDEWIVVEQGITARELEVGVLGYHDLKTSVVGEIVPTHEFYDYDDKYVDGAAEMIIPAVIPDDVAAQARELALRAFTVLRCDGLARVDFFYEEEGRGLLFNEINTLPGFTPFSMFPSLWSASGLGYGELIDELVELALQRHEHRARFRDPR
ncbi:MAG: D-alanine--D-alanine ligase family protein [Aquihabitans sp.]